MRGSVIDRAQWFDDDGDDDDDLLHGCRLIETLATKALPSSPRTLEQTIPQSGTIHFHFFTVARRARRRKKGRGGNKGGAFFM